MNEISPRPALYETDFAAWLEQQTALLRSGRFDRLDVANLAEELEGLGISQRHALASHTRVALWHLLKWQHQASRRTASWRITLRNARAEIANLLQASPSLRRRLAATIETEYPRARHNAADETGLPLSTFPADCPYSAEQLLDPDFLPE